MPLTNFPNGISSFGMPVVGSGGLMTTGNVFFVDSGAANASNANAATDPSAPAATVDGTIAKCTASNGDIIFVMPGHTETVTASDVTLDVAGVSVIGLGQGNSRPTFTMGAAGSTFSITAASCRISNIILEPGATDVAAGITVSGASAEIDNCLFKPHATSEFTNMISVTAVEDVIIRDNVLHGLDGTAGATGIRLNGCDRLQVLRNVIIGDFSTGCIENVTDQCLSVYISRNTCRNMSTSGTITMLANATGIIEYNSLGFDGSGTAQYVPGNTRNTENYLSNADDETATIVPTTAST